MNVTRDRVSSSERDVKEIAYQGLCYHWHAGAFLSRTQAEYALAQLWRLCAGSASWDGSAAVDIPALERGPIEETHAPEQEHLQWVRLNALLPRDVKIGLDSDRLPALCLSGGKDACFYNGTGPFPLDLVAATFLLLTRWEEMQNPSDLDVWGNFPASATLGGRHGFLDRPVLDEWAAVIRAWLKAKNQGWREDRETFRIRMTHDIDHPYKFTSLYRVLRVLAKAVLRDRSVGKAMKQLLLGVRSRINPSADPFCCGVEALMSLDESLGVYGTFFFMTADPGPFDEGYDLSSPRCRRLLEDVLSRGHEVGWHPSYQASENENVFWREKARMDDVMEGTPYGARFHYLRWQVGRSWKMLADAGCLFDSSLGFNETTGFRCGTSLPFPAYDLGAELPLSLEERPFSVQDNALFHCMGLDRSAAAERVGLLLDRVRVVSGEMTIVIHNSKQEEEDKASTFFKCCFDEKLGPGR